jgi:biopolymer transport protein TolR
MGASLGKKGFVSEINVTPFVDVMLVLLIIFMVTAPMMTEGLEVNLPETRAVTNLPTESDNMVFTVKPNGEMFLDTYPIELADIETKVRLLVTEKKKQLFLQADRDVAYGIVVDVMGRLKSAGVDNLGIVAQREDREPAPRRPQGSSSR